MSHDEVYYARILGIGTLFRLSGTQCGVFWALELCLKMDHASLEHLSMEQLQEEAHRFHLHEADCREAIINAIMTHLECNSSWLDRLRTRRPVSPALPVLRAEEPPVAYPLSGASRVEDFPGISRSSPGSAPDDNFSPSNMANMFTQMMSAISGCIQ